MAPWSWMAAIVVRIDRYDLTGSVRPSASRWPPRVVTSSPTMTSTGRPRSRAIARPATPASMRSWSVMAMTSSPRSTARSSTLVTDAVPSEATVWMWRSARPGRSTRSSVPPRSTWARGSVMPPALTPPPLQVGPDREEDRPPLLGGVLDDPLERGREGGHRGRDALSSRAIRRDRDRDQATAVVAPTAPPDAHAVHRHAALDGEHGGAHRQDRRGAEQRDAGSRRR